MMWPPRKQIPCPPPTEIAMFAAVTNRASAASIVVFWFRLVLVNATVCTPLSVIVGLARVHGTATGGGCVTVPQAARTATTARIAVGDHATASFTVRFRRTRAP